MLLPQTDHRLEVDTANVGEHCPPPLGRTESSNDGVRGTPRCMPEKGLVVGLRACGLFFPPDHAPKRLADTLGEAFRISESAVQARRRRVRCA